MIVSGGEEEREDVDEEREWGGDGLEDVCVPNVVMAPQVTLGVNVRIESAGEGRRRRPGGGDGRCRWSGEEERERVLCGGKSRKCVGGVVPVE